MSGWEFRAGVPRGGRQWGAGRKRGFTIMEIMIVVTIIGLLAVVAIPSWMSGRMRSRNAAFENDLRVLTAEAFGANTIEAQDFPPDSPPGVPPPEVVSSLPKRFDWTKKTPIGGQWDWDRAPSRGQKVHGICYAGLAVYQPARTSGELRVIDERIDDGDLATGLFREYDNGCIYIVSAD